jgi:3-hydroxymyristoyl/3-hydroxydecanoyl-(acyl carrier protein) dehydratase
MAGHIPYFMAIDKAKFRKVVVPGDQMRIEVELLKLRTKTARFKACVLVDGVLASEAEMMCMITEGTGGQ